MWLLLAFLFTALLGVVGLAKGRIEDFLTRELRRSRSFTESTMFIGILLFTILAAFFTYLDNRSGAALMEATNRDVSAERSARGITEMRTGYAGLCRTNRITPLILQTTPQRVRWCSAPTTSLPAFWSFAPMKPL